MTAWRDLEAAATALVGGPNVRVTQLASYSDWPHVLERVTLQVAVRGDSKEAAQRAAYSARDTLFAWPDTDPATARFVRLVVGPVWQPLPDGTPVYTVTVAVGSRVQPSQLVGGNSG